MGEMSGSMSFGITWYSVIFLALGAAVVSLLAEVLPLQVYRYSPSLLALIAGKDAAARWVSGQPAPVAPVSPAAACSSRNCSSRQGRAGDAETSCGVGPGLCRIQEEGQGRWFLGSSIGSHRRNWIRSRRTS